MNTVSKPIQTILNEPNTYDEDISYLNSVLCYIDFFENIEEEDYLIHNGKNRIEYSPQLYSFIHSLHKANLVASDDELDNFLERFDCLSTEKCSCFNLWIKDMNKIITDEAIIKRTNIKFLRITISTLLKLEKFFPGSWGIDIENGNWLRILNQLKRIYPSVYKPSKSNLC